MAVDEEFSEFVRARSPALHRTAFLLTAGDQQSAEDLVQSALLKTYVRWSSLRRSASAEAYVRRTLTRMAIRTKAKRSSTEQLWGEVPTGSTPGVDSKVVDRVTILALLHDLTPQQRAVVVLRYYEDLTESQIAEVLGCAPGTVKSHASRAIAMLRSELASKGAARGAAQGRGRRGDT